MKSTICLASKSKSRKDVLDRAFVQFKSLTSSISEIYEGETVDEYVLKLAKMKCEDVIGRTDAEIVIGADSVAILEGEIIEKPRNEVEAIKILEKLQGKTHIFCTGLNVAKLNPKEVLSRFVTTKDRSRVETVVHLNKF